LAAVVQVITFVESLTIAPSVTIGENDDRAIAPHLAHRFAREKERAA